jgi:hypothetical protein
MTPQELRDAAAGYPEANMRAAVAAGIKECPLSDVPAEPGFSSLVAFWLLEPDGWDWFPPPLPESTIAAIYRRLLAGAH